MNALQKSITMCAVALFVTAGYNYAGCASCGPAAAPAKAEVAEIDTHVLEKLISSGVEVTLLDARGPKVAATIPGAVALSSSITAKEAKKVIKSKDSLIVTYCTSPKCGASKGLAKELTKLGYKNIIEYPAGIEGWKKHGNKVAKNK